jgi:putative addiction module antidote
MVRKIFRTGNSLVVSLPADTIRVLALEEGTEVTVALDEGQQQIIIKPVTTSPKSIDKTFATQVADFIEQYRSALESLARQ